MPYTEPGPGPRESRRWYTLAEAARKADRTERTIQTWSAAGLLVTRWRLGRKEYRGLELAEVELSKRQTHRRIYHRHGS